MRLQQALLALERRQAPGWFFVSVATDFRFVGGAFVQAHGPRTAVERTAQLGVSLRNASAECTPVTDEEILRIPESMRERRLSETEVRGLGGE